MKNILVTFICFFIVANAYTQQTITLQDAINQAIQHYPISKQKDLTKQLGKLNEKIISNKFLPQMDIVGQATYQSEVTVFALPGGPSIPAMSKDQYSFGPSVNYSLTNHNEIKTENELDAAKTELSLNQYDIDQQRLKERITNLFANILIQQKNKEIQFLRKSDLNTQLKKISSGVSDGSTLKSNQLVFESEILVSDQHIEDIDATLLGMIQEINILTGLQLNNKTEFQLNKITTIDSSAINRPELRVFQSQEKVLSLQKSLIKKQEKPTVYLLGQGLYGRSGYNILNNDFRPYGIAGLGLNWSLNNLMTSPKKEKTIDINQQLVNRQHELFSMNLEASLASKSAEINKYPDIISKDEQIVEKRKQILKVVASQLENGAITSTEYLTELNAENSAELNMLLHQVQSEIAKNQYNTLLGN